MIAFPVPRMRYEQDVDVERRRDAMEQDWQECQRRDREREYQPADDERTD